MALHPFHFPKTPHDIRFPTTAAAFGTLVSCGIVGVPPSLPPSLFLSTIINEVIRRHIKCDDGVGRTGHQDETHDGMVTTGDVTRVSRVGVLRHTS